MHSMLCKKRNTFSVYWCIIAIMFLVPVIIPEWLKNSIRTLLSSQLLLCVSFEIIIKLKEMMDRIKGRVAIKGVDTFRNISRQSYDIKIDRKQVQRGVKKQLVSLSVHQFALTSQNHIQNIKLNAGGNQCKNKNSNRYIG